MKRRNDRTNRGLSLIASQTQKTPLDTYKDVRFNGKRQFELFADTIRVRGSVTLQLNYDTTIPLSRMDPRVIRLFVRNRLFFAGLWIAMAGFVSYPVLIAEFHLDPLGNALGALGCVGISGVLLCLANVRKTEFARFESNAGVPVLDIARAGPDRDKFDEFVNRVLEQICSARSVA